MSEEISPIEAEAIFWAQLRAASAEKRKSNRAYSTQLLADKGVRFRENSNAHLTVYHPDGRPIDFWPGTGLWKVAGDATKRRGVQSLLRYVGANK